MFVILNPKYGYAARDNFGGYTDRLARAKLYKTRAYAIRDKSERGEIVIKRSDILQSN